MVRFSKKICFVFSAWVLCLVLVPSLRSHQENRSAPKVVATVQGVPVTEDDLLNAAAADLENLEQQRQQFEANYTRGKQQIMEQNLERLIETKLLDAAAAKKGITRQALLAEQVDSKVKEPTPEEINSFYESNKQRINKPKEDVSAQIQQLLKQQSRDRFKAELLRGLKTEYAVVSLLEPLRMPVTATGQPVRGPAGAPVTLIEFSDFQCPYCRTMAATLAQVLKAFPKDVRLVYRQFPLNSIHPQAQKAAEASLCAEEQGRFWEMHDLMFQEQGNLKPEDLKAKAARLNMDGAAFGACLDSGKYAERIRQDSREGARAGVSGTPALFINGRPLNGSQPYAEIARVINNELERINR